MRISIHGVGVAVMLLYGSGIAHSSVDRSPPPGGVYRLKPGIYVARGTSCGSPPNVAIRHYDGRGIGTAHTRSCRARIISRKGGTFVADQSCIDAGAGPAPRVTERQVVTVRDALTFSLGRPGSATTYRYCPIDALPADLRSAVKQAAGA